MPPKLPLPRGWKRRVRSSVLHILCVAKSTCWNNGPFHSAPGPVHLWRYPRSYGSVSSSRHSRRSTTQRWAIPRL